MTYIITSKEGESKKIPGIELGNLLHIKVQNRPFEEQPILAFATVELAEKFLTIRNLPNKNYSIETIEAALPAKDKHKSVLIFEEEGQLLEMEKDTEGYDYERQIRQTAL